MVAYTSLEMTPPKYPTSGPGIGGRNVHSARGEFTTTANLAAADTITLFRIHPGGRVQAGFIKSDAIESTSASTYNVGIAGTPALFFAGSTVGRTGGGVDRNLAFAGTDWVNTSRRFVDVILTVGTAPTTPVIGGKIVVVLQLTTEEPA